MRNFCGTSEKSSQSSWGESIVEAKAGEGTLLLPLNLLEKHQFGLLQQCFEVQESKFNEVRKA